MSGGFYSAYQVAPVTQQAVVTANAAFDRLLCNARRGESEDQDPEFQSTDDHVYSIAQRELCFRLNHKYDDVIARPNANGINDLSLIHI